MRIGVIGGGTVGSAVARCFMEWADVRVYDTRAALSTHTQVEALDADLVFVCLPTPQEGGDEHPGARPLSADLSAIDQFFEAHRGYTRSFVLRSTVPIGTTQRLREQYSLPQLIHSPEFLTARCAMTDAQIPSRNVIGGPECVTTDRLKQFYRERFPGVPIHRMTSDESEAVKLFTNGFFAVKIAYFNEVEQLCGALGMDWETVRYAVLADGRIAHSHTRVPGPDGKRGFGNHCLPKDLASLIDCLTRAGVPAEVTAAALRRNREDVER